MAFTYEFTKMDRTQYPDWQGIVKAAVTLAQQRGHPIEQVIAPNTAYPQDWPTSSYDTADKTCLVFDQELTAGELAALNTLFSNPATVCAPGFPGYGPTAAKTRLKLNDVWNNLAAMIITQSGLPSNCCTIWVDNVNPNMHNEEWDTLYLDFNLVLTVQQRRAVEAAFAAQASWILP